MTKNITNEMQNDINAAWNELEVITANFEKLSAEEIKQRIGAAKYWISKHTTDTELLPIDEAGIMECYEIAVNEQNCTVSFEQFVEDNGYNL